jgi:cytochrome d ubiquinol oxidase subunit II
MAATVLSIFTELYPRVMVSSTNPAYNLTISNTASGSYSLKLMTIVVVIFLPVVLLYQAWTYYVFRQRISPGDFQLPRLASRGSPDSAKAGPPAGGEPSSAPQ